MGFDPKVVWMDGKLVDFQHANVHFLTSALHYGLGVFEGNGVKVGNGDGVLVGI